MASMSTTGTSKPRRPSTASLNINPSSLASSAQLAAPSTATIAGTAVTATNATATTQQQSQPMFRLPSNLPPIENGEVIQMDIETYRALMQDLHNFKTILHKLANTLRDGGNEQQQQDHPTDLLSSFYQVNSSNTKTVISALLKF